MFKRKHFLKSVSFRTIATLNNVISQPLRFFTQLSFEASQLLNLLFTSGRATAQKNENLKKEQKRAWCYRRILISRSVCHIIDPVLHVNKIENGRMEYHTQLQTPVQVGIDFFLKLQTLHYIFLSFDCEKCEYVCTM